MTDSKRDWVKTAIELIGIFLMILTFTLRAEHRQTVVEERQNAQAAAIEKLTKAIEMFAVQHQTLATNQATITQILNQINERHKVEDEKKRP